MRKSSYITRNYQITIPKEIRKAMPFLKEGDIVDFEIIDDKLMLIPQQKVSIHINAPDFKSSDFPAKVDKTFSTLQKSGIFTNVKHINMSK